MGLVEEKLQRMISKMHCSIFPTADSAYKYNVRFWLYSNLPSKLSWEGGVWHWDSIKVSNAVLANEMAQMSLTAQPGHMLRPGYHGICALPHTY